MHWKPKSFSEEYSNKVKPEDHFQNFIGELFVQDYPGLITYQTSGRDGGIDLFQPEQGVVFECKFINEAGVKAAEKSWKKVECTFDKHLIAKKPSQSQYQPWYSDHHYIKAYYFCVSHDLKNESRRQELEKQIREAFIKFSSRCPSLSHLAKIKVEVWSWDRLAPKLLSRPELLIRWFPSLKPPGLDFLNINEPLKDNFRDYLNPLRLGFMPSPELTVENTLGLIDKESIGLVLHGKGGIGKTRLMRETGLYALTQGWLVYSINTILFKIDGLLQLVRQAAGCRILLLLDYLENFQRLEELTAQIDEWNALGGVYLRLLVTCRDSYREQINLGDLGECNLNFVRNDEIVAHILKPIPEAVRLQNICGDIPIFAVFVRYIYDRNQTDCLNELLADGDFKSWWKKRLPVFANSSQDGNAKVASRLFAAYPCPDDVLDALQQRCPPTGELHRILSQDGWVFMDDETGTWNLAHDLLADRTLLDELLPPVTRCRALRQVLGDAYACGFQENVIQSLQRISAELPNTPWLDLFKEQPERWRPYVPKLSASRLFNLVESLQFLEAYAEDRDSLVTNPIVRGRLGHLARWCWKNPDESKDLDHQALMAWLDIAVQKEDYFNFVINYALHLDCERYREATLGWLKNHSESFYADYLICAWLRMKLPSKDVLNYLQRWLNTYWRSRRATFIFRAWLEETSGIEEFKPLLQAGGFIEQGIKNWLSLYNNRISPDAHFVFKVWLDATKSRTLVENSIRDWLTVENNRVSTNAHLVFKSWLDATQDGHFVKKAIEDWLAVPDNRTDFKASYVFPAWLNATQDRKLVEQAIFDWLAVDSNRYCLDASYVINAWLKAKGEKKQIQPYLSDWLAYKDNAISSEADFIYRTCGSIDNYLSDEILHYACKWVCANADSPNANHCITFVAKSYQLKAQTTRAILHWCGLGFSKRDAMNRMGSLGKNLLTVKAIEAIPLWERLLTYCLDDRKGIRELHEFRHLQYTFPVLYRLAMCDKDKSSINVLIHLFARCVEETNCFDCVSMPNNRSLYNEDYPNLLAELLTSIRGKPKPELFEGIQECLKWIDIWPKDEKDRYCINLNKELVRRQKIGWCC